MTKINLDSVNSHIIMTWVSIIGGLVLLIFGAVDEKVSMTLFGFGMGKLAATMKTAGDGK